MLKSSALPPEHVSFKILEVNKNAMGEYSQLLLDEAADPGGKFLAAVPGQGVSPHNFLSNPLEFQRLEPPLK